MHRCDIIRKTFTFSSNSQTITQKNNYPWIAALIREEVNSNTYVNTKCGSSLVVFLYQFYFSNKRIDFLRQSPSLKIEHLQLSFYSPQIGSTWVVTAAHCVFEDEELVDAKTLSVLLGLHDRSKNSERNRWFFISYLSLFLYFPLKVWYFRVFLSRRKVQVDEILVHENYTAGGSKENDIALLRLGEKTFCCQCTL